METSPGFMCWNSFVLVEGLYTEEKEFIVSKIESPSGESRKDTLFTHSDRVDLFNSLKPRVDPEILLVVEKREETAFVFLSEVWVIISYDD